MVALQITQLGPVLHLVLSREGSRSGEAHAHFAVMWYTAVPVTEHTEWMEVIHFDVEEVRSLNPEMDLGVKRGSET